MKNLKLLNLLQRYLDNKISDLELDELNKLLKNKAHLKEAEAFLRDDYNKVTQNVIVDTDAALKKFKKLSYKKPSKTILLRPYFKYVAAAVVIIGVFFGSLFLNPVYNDTFSDDYKPQNITLVLEDGTEKKLKNNTLKTSILTSNNDVIANTENGNLKYNKTKLLASVSYNTLKVPYGKRFSIELSDGSKIDLNSGTTLRYPVSFFNANTRELFLEEGEAYFNVAKDVEKKFIVHTKAQDVEVLGTHFSISNYTNEKTVRTTLQEGSVKVTTTNDYNNQVTLKPNEQTVIHKETNIFKKQKVNVSSFLSWRKGHLVFVEMPFSEILLRLERHFGKAIINKNEALKDSKFSAYFEDETLEQIINYFALGEDFEFVENGNTIVIK